MVVTTFKPHINPGDHQLKMENEYRAKLQEIIKGNFKPIPEDIREEERRVMDFFFCKGREE